MNFEPEIVLRMGISGMKGGEGNKGEDRPTGVRDTYGIRGN